MGRIEQVDEKSFELMTEFLVAIQELSNEVINGKYKGMWEAVTALRDLEVIDIEEFGDLVNNVTDIAYDAGEIIHDINSAIHSDQFAEEGWTAYDI